MKFGLKKCSRVTIVKGKLKKKEYIEDSEEEFITELDPFFFFVVGLGMDLKKA